MKGTTCRAGATRAKMPGARLRAGLAACVGGAVAAGLLWAAPVYAAGPAGRHAAPLIDAGSGAGHKFRSSGRLLAGPGGGTACTATVVAASAEPAPAQKALVLTNGHCVRDTLGTNEVVADQPAPEGWSFTPAFFHDNTAEHKTFGVERVEYATMKDTDVAVLRLSVTYGDLAQLDVTPRTLSPTGTPARGTRLEAAHAPIIGVPDDERFLRLSSCQVTGSDVSVHEYTWLWKGFARTDCRGVSGGSSGGPVTTATDNRLVGLINTVATPGYLGCGLGRPCEGSAHGLVVPADDSVYVTPVDAVASCLDRTGLRLHRNGCRLDPGIQVNVQFSGTETQSHTPEGPARWDAHITAGGGGHQSYVAFKTGPFGATDCTNPQGYGRPQRLGKGGADYARLLPTQDNLYVLCAAGGPDATFQGAGWTASLTHPSYAYARIDNTPPTVEPSLDIQKFGEGSDADYRVRPVFDLWELTSFEIKYGPAATTDCADLSGYHPYRRVPVTLSASEGPWTYCAVGYDNAGNQTPPKAFRIE
ncbi:Trypsin-like peptidase domain-containing protein [Streptomyces sp. 2323.1]|nr:Trypsin-like peptidase domain-containing protein [Streptomyces sp. 2323.1]